MPQLDASDGAQLKALEEAVDVAVAGLPLVKMPVRALLAFVHYFLFSTLHGPLLANKPTREVAVTAASRLGYLLPLFLRMPADPYGWDAEDAVKSAMEVDPDGAQLSELLAYAHFSQFMPEVWRGYFNLNFANEYELHLTHRDADFAAREGGDILLSELALPFKFNRDRAKPDPDIARMVQTKDDAFMPLLISAVMRRAATFRSSHAETTPVDDAAMTEIFGFDASTFRRIQAALLGLAEVADEAAMFLAAWKLRETGGKEIDREALEWLSVNLRPDIVIGLSAAVADAAEAQVEAFIDAYAIDFRKGPPTHRGGDGFFPPFMRGNGTLLFSPILVLSSLSARNAVYGFSEFQRQAQDAARKAAAELPEDRFGAYIANVLEPQLLAHTKARLPANHGWRVLDSVAFPGGEIDLVLIDEAAQFGICFQAKAPLPPQGARMTQRLLERVNEGIGQIERFLALPEVAQRFAIEARLGSAKPSLRLHHGLLTPACFGAEAWAHRDRLLLVTPGLVGLAAKAHVAREPLERFAARLVETLDDYVSAAKPHWEIETIKVAGHSVSLPLLKFDHDYVDRIRETAWPGEPPPPIELVYLVDA